MPDLTKIEVPNIPSGDTASWWVGFLKSYEGDVTLSAERARELIAFLEGKVSDDV